MPNRGLGLPKGSRAQPRSRTSPTTPASRKKPVTWLSPSELWRTGREAQRGTEFARYADKREAQGIYPAAIYDLTSGRAAKDSFVVDYLADTGDGFDATFATASSVNGCLPGRPPADLLVLGGDEVYPVASVLNYEERLTVPFDLAGASATAKAQARIKKSFVFALPGNHDWYDGLVAFRQTFCESWIDDPTIASGSEAVLVPTTPERWRDDILGRQLAQTRSYFSVKLPHGWWLWGVDTQLDSHIDAAQLSYFTQARSMLGRNDRVIVCVARPSWTDPSVQGQEYWTTNRGVLVWFIDRMFKQTEYRGSGDRRHQVAMLLTGDKHHFAHYERTSDSVTSPRHLITCGGGGAYLSSTHHLEKTLGVRWSTNPDDDVTTYAIPKEVVAGEEEEQGRKFVFPSFRDSKKLKWTRFPSLLWRNGIVLPVLIAGIQCGLTALAMGVLGDGNRPSRIGIWAAALALAIVLGALSFVFPPPHLRLRQDSPSEKNPVIGWVRKYASRFWNWTLRALPGVLHAAFHVGVAFGMALLATHVFPTAVVMILGPAIALFGFASYFAIADCLHFHENELFSAMKISDYKSHLRLTITPPKGRSTLGKLRVDVMGIPNVRKQKTGKALLHPTLVKIDSFEYAG